VQDLVLNSATTGTIEITKADLSFACIKEYCVKPIIVTPADTYTVKLFIYLGGAWNEIISTTTTAIWDFSNLYFIVPIKFEITPASVTDVTVSVCMPVVEIQQ
jgi:hypothetical protein